MTHEKMLAALARKGWTQWAIAVEIGRTQSTVCDIASGKTKDLRLSTAREIEALWRRECAARKVEKV